MGQSIVKKTIGARILAPQVNTANNSLLIQFEVAFGSTGSAEVLVRIEREARNASSL
jgi:hypothetical protein